MSMSLSQRLRDETRSAHTAAERSGIMQPLLRGTITRAQYVGLLQQLALIYEALEAGVHAHRDLHTLKFIDLRVLERTPALREDLGFLAGPNSALARVPAASTYVKRLQRLRETAPSLLGAHAYVRYLGDLSGGQVLGRIVRKALHLPDARGTAFYEFPEIPDIGSFKQSFRESLDQLMLSPAESDAFVTEALLGFELHEQLFEQLSAEAITTNAGSGLSR
jgi:heme oxygenase